MKKRITIAFLGLIVVIGILAGIKVLQIRRMMAQGEHFLPPPETITTAEVRKDSWEVTISAVGSLAAIQGMNLTAELPGRITEIAFESGAGVQKGDLLVRFDTSSEEAQLRSAKAEADLARISFDRADLLIKKKSITGADYDSAKAKLEKSLAQCDIIRSVIAKKTVRAPFAGRLGIRLVTIGQILREGDPMVGLQALNPIYVNFLLPQQELARVSTGIPVRVSSDTMPGEDVAGTITAIDPEVDEATRNVRIQATIDNREERLRPGMFVNVSVVRAEQEEVLAIPATAVQYAPYSNSVFLVEDRKEKDRKGKALRQQFVRLGEKRGDFVAVLDGLKGGETIASTGVFKLRNGMAVVVDNTLAPENKLNPAPQDS